MPPKDSTGYTIGFTDEDGFHLLGKLIEACTLESGEPRCKIKRSDFGLEWNGKH